MTNPAEKIISNLARAAIQHIDKEQAAFNSMNDTVDQIASNLVREGINKHKARELAVHFIRLVQRDMSPNPENDDTKSECVADADEQKPVGEVVEAFAGLTAVSIPEMPPVGTKLYTQPAQPVAWTSRELEFIDEMIVVQLRHADRCDNIKNPVAEKQKQWDLERVAILRKAKRMSQREWVGLTDEEIHDEALKLMRQHKTGYLGIARAVEAMLKEKNA